MLRWLVTLAASWMLLGTAPAAACSIISDDPVCAPTGECAGPVFEQFNLQREMRDATEHAQRVAGVVEQRERSAGLDRAYDIARLILPNLVLPHIGYNSCGDFVEDGDASGGQDPDEFLARLPITVRSPVPHVQMDLLLKIFDQRAACNAEIRRDFARSLNRDLTNEQLTDVWRFILPRSGEGLSTDPNYAISSLRLTALTGNAPPLTFYAVPNLRQHIKRRRELAWEYLQSNDNGRAVMSAVSQFIQLRLADGRGEAAICPLAHAETQRLMTELAAQH